MLEFRSNPENKRKVWKPAADKREVLVLYATPEKGTIFMDAISQSEYAEETKALSRLNEIDFELAIDQNATILIETRVCKVRRLSKAIGNSLKIVYGYRCQICGQYIGEQYGSDLIHTHHIDYFTSVAIWTSIVIFSLKSLKISASIAESRSQRTLSM